MLDGSTASSSATKASASERSAKRAAARPASDASALAPPRSVRLTSTPVYAVTIAGPLTSA